MQWIRVKDRLPDKTGDYLVVRRDEDGDRVISVRYWHENYKRFSINWIEEHIFSHWMPLPDLPEEE